MSSPLDTCSPRVATLARLHMSSGSSVIAPFILCDCWLRWAEVAAACCRGTWARTGLEPCSKRAESSAMTAFIADRQVQDRLTNVLYARVTDVDADSVLLWSFDAAIKSTRYKIHCTRVALVSCPIGNSISLRVTWQAIASIVSAAMAVPWE